MRRLTSFMGIMLSLLLSGWGSVFAAAFCPHLALRNLTAKVEASSCHQMSEEQAIHSEARRQAMDGMEMTPVAQHDNDEIVPVGKITGTCTHCMDKDRSPDAVANARELSFQKRDAGAFIEKPATIVASNPIFFQPKFIATQNAPPGAANRKHLIIGVFLI